MIKEYSQANVSLRTFQNKCKSFVVAKNKTKFLIRIINIIKTLLFLFASIVLDHKTYDINIKASRKNMDELKLKETFDVVQSVLGSFR